MLVKEIIERIERLEEEVSVCDVSNAQRRYIELDRLYKELDEKLKSKPRAPRGYDRDGNPFY